MTLYHFGNCLALVYAPYHMAYKFSGISEYATFSKCVYAGGLYIFTQLCKMLLLATFFPDSDNSHIPGEYNIFWEILKATVDFADLFGIYFALNAVPGKGHAKILTSAIGWASAEVELSLLVSKYTICDSFVVVITSISEILFNNINDVKDLGTEVGQVLVTRSVPLWVGARGSEFEWRYVRSCAESNVSLVHTGATAALVWLWARSDLPRRHAPLVGSLLALAPYRPLLEEGVARALSLGAWSLLALRAVHASALALTSLGLYAVLAHQIGI